MADIASLPFFLAIGRRLGIVPDTLDIGYRPDEFRPWGECTLTAHLADATDHLLLGETEIRLQALIPPATVLLVPVTARIETGVLRFARQPAPAGDIVPPSLEQQAEQQAADGVPLLANSAPLELGTNKLVYAVDFGPMTILGRSYRFSGFYFEAPTVVAGGSWHLEVEGATSGTFDVTITVAAGAPATATIAFDATPAAVVAAFEALPNVAPGDIATTGTDLTAGLTLTFGGALAGQPVALTLDTTNLVGGAGVDLHELAGAIVDLTTVDRWTAAVP